MAAKKKETPRGLGSLPDGVAVYRTHGVAIRSGLVCDERFDHQPVLTLPGGFGSPTGTAGNLAEAHYRRGLASQIIEIGAEAIVGPVFDYTLGLLDISESQTVDLGSEEDYGGLSPANPYIFIPGTTAPMSYEFTVEVEDVSGVAECAFGIRKLEPTQALIDDYADMIIFNLQVGVLSIETIKGGAATVTTATAKVWADAGVHAVKIVASGNSFKAYFDGAQIRGLPAYAMGAVSFVPFRFNTHATDLSKVYPTRLLMGPVSEF